MSDIHPISREAVHPGTEAALRLVIEHPAHNGYVVRDRGTASPPVPSCAELLDQALREHQEREVWCAPEWLLAAASVVGALLGVWMLICFMAAIAAL
jgi:hypothetical protein